jgi:hypothetical protein
VPCPPKEAFTLKQRNTITDIAISKVNSAGNDQLQERAMIDAVQELKIRAQLIHRKVRIGDEIVLKRLHKVPELRKKFPEAVPANEVQLKHCLVLVAQEFGFSTWLQANQVLSGQGQPQDFGTLLYGKSCGGFNTWFADYQEALDVHHQTQGYLLAYKRQYFIVGPDFIQDLGLNPKDPDWDSIARNWPRPANMEARNRLYSKIIATFPAESSIHSELLAQV